MQLATPGLLVFVNDSEQGWIVSKRMLISKGIHIVCMYVHVWIKVEMHSSSVSRLFNYLSLWKNELRSRMIKTRSVSSGNDGNLIFNRNYLNNFLFEIVDEKWTAFAHVDLHIALTM